MILIYQKLEELKNSDKTIVIVSHSLESVKKLCNRAVWLYNGEVRKDGKPVDEGIPYLTEGRYDISYDVEFKFDGQHYEASKALVIASTILILSNSCKLPSRLITFIIYKI